MYFYSFVMESSDGIAWSAEFAHKGKFDDSEFQRLCEKSLLSCCRRAPATMRKEHLSTMRARDFVLEFMEKEFGFIRLEHSSVYGFDPRQSGLVGSGELRRLVFG